MYSRGMIDDVIVVGTGLLLALLVCVGLLHVLVLWIV